MSYTHLETRRIKATRKPWSCDICGRRFDIGTPKVRVRGIIDGCPCTDNYCETCDWATGKYAEETKEREWTFDNIHDYILGEWGSIEGADDAFNQDEPKYGGVA